ncbi:TetR-like C-terminal domain-containing protein [uncultured Faecalibaculum sp.]|uniref:TetR-like C-terminal domain-containing protein n=1 Tax=uncultured Faecalibaculum sp. TaxID=1729681 RepID=UPI0026286B32|nr:TetR-like C-terminal domain-containing protein [uncultured Faecalibaculum sp.]
MDRRTARTKESIQRAYLGLQDECDTGEIKIAVLCREVYRRICSSHGDVMFLQRLMSRLSRVLHPALIRLYPDLDETRRKWRLSYILSGCMGLISRWIREGMQESPEEVARELTALTEQNAGLGQRGVCCRGQVPGSRK